MRLFRDFLPIIFIAFFSFSVFAQVRLESAKPWMGVSIEQGKKGVIINRSFPSTPAEKAGLTQGDEILSVNDQKVKTPQELIQLVTALGIGNTAKVEFLRKGKTLTVKLALVLKPETSELLKKLLLHQKAPDFSLPVALGKESGKLLDLKGKVILIKFWATWCPACRASLPSLDDFAKTNKEVTVLAISDEDEVTIKKFFQGSKPYFSVLSCKDKDTPRDYNVSALPTLFVIDRNGIVRFAEIGAGQILEEAEKTALALIKEK